MEVMGKGWCSAACSRITSHCISRFDTVLQRGLYQKSFSVVCAHFPGHLTCHRACSQGQAALLSAALGWQLDAEVCSTVCGRNGLASVKQRLLAWHTCVGLTQSSLISVYVVLNVGSGKSELICQENLIPNCYFWKWMHSYLHTDFILGEKVQQQCDGYGIIIVVQIYFPKYRIKRQNQCY